MLSRLCAYALLCVSLVGSVPLLTSRQTSVACPSASPNDAPYDVPCSTMQAALTCPYGITGKAGGIVLLVEGTASTGTETWQLGPYVQILPGLDPDYDVCFLTGPERSLGDLQTSAEYVAYNIHQLAPQSRTGKVSLIGWSQGNLNIQWALSYWPSTQRLVSSFVSLAGDFHGTAEGPLACLALNLTQGGCAPGILQQNVGSNYLAAQNTVANGALVPTTSLYTRFDDVIQPELGSSPTSDLPGAVVIAMQDADVCGPTHIVDHFLMTVDSASFFLAYDALRHGTASTSRFNSSNCVFDYGGNLAQQFSTVPGVLRNALFAAIAVVADNPRTTSEPPLKSYVCESHFPRPLDCNQPHPATPQIATESMIPPNVGSLVTPGPIGTAFSVVTRQIASAEVPTGTVSFVPPDITATPGQPTQPKLPTTI